MKKNLILILGVILGIVGFAFIVHNLFNIHITAVFEDLEPFPKNLNVYYKGFKLGRSIRVHPSKDFTTTQVDMVLKAKDLSLPDNITAKVKSKNKKDYIELEYPDAPSITYLKNHSFIQGKNNFFSHATDFPFLKEPRKAVNRNNSNPRWRNSYRFPSR